MRDLARRVGQILGRLLLAFIATVVIGGLLGWVVMGFTDRGWWASFLEWRAAQSRDVSLSDYWWLLLLVFAGLAYAIKSDMAAAAELRQRQHKEVMNALNRIAKLLEAIENHTAPEETRAARATFERFYSLLFTDSEAEGSAKSNASGSTPGFVDPDVDFIIDTMKERSADGSA